MKKLMTGLLVLFALILMGCDGTEVMADVATGADKSEDQSVELTDIESQADELDTDIPAQVIKTQWPEEFEKWDVPVIESANISSADNRSATQDGLTQGVTAVVNLKNLSRADFDAYLSAIEANGFIYGEGDSMGDIIYVYSKAVTDGEISMMLFYDAETTSITMSNSAAAKEKIEQAGGDVEWPSSLIDIPAFTKGKFKETVEMGGGMYSINYIGVNEADVDWYRQELEAAGFLLQDSEQTDGYMRMDADMAYSVGFTLEGDIFQVVAIGQSY